MGASLNPDQLSAVNTLRGPLLVLAGAGAGKTRVVTHRIANLIRHGTAADRILAVTFTRKAAGEMHERAMELLAGSRRPARGGRRPGGPKPHISTFHALCVQVLRRHIRLLEYPAEFAICDRGDQEALARAALRELKVADAQLAPGDLLAIVSSWKNRSMSPGHAASSAVSDREHLAAAAYRRYQDHLKTRGMVDFDDLLLLAETLLTKQPAVRREEAGRFEHVLIDEYQDTNGSQYRIVKALAMAHRNLCVVGDDDQSIYGWRGAEVRHILNFRQDWPDAKVVHLVDNYRSTAAILGHANTLIAFNRQRHEKQLRAARRGGDPPRIAQLADETKEAEFVVGDIQRRLSEPGARAGQFAILCRTNEQPRAFERELRQARIPYVLVGGMSFFDRKEVRDVLAYLKAVENPGDESSILRILNTPPRGIGNATVQQLVAAAVAQGVPLWETLQAPAAAGLAPAAAEAVRAFVQLLTDLREISRRVRLVDAVQAVVERTGYRREIERVYPDPNEREARWLTIEELQNAAGSYHDKAREPTLRGFLNDMALDGPGDADDKESKLQQNAVVLMTLHAAKGLEFPYVYMVGLEEGILPHRRTLEMADDSGIDEERRLCYVGVTRAQDRLTLSFALGRRKWGKLRPTVPSRFLYEMTGQAEKAADARRRAAESPAARDPQARKKTAPRSRASGTAQAATSEGPPRSRTRKT